jgi:hypothetical protein
MQGIIPEQPRNALGEGIQIPIRDQNAVALIVNNKRNAADACSNDWQSANQCFTQSNALRFLLRMKDEGTSFPEER